MAMTVRNHDCHYPGDMVIRMRMYGAGHTTRLLFARVHVGFSQSKINHCAHALHRSEAQFPCIMSQEARRMTPPSSTIERALSFRQFQCDLEGFFLVI